MSAAWNFARASAAASAPSQLVRIGGTPELCLCLSTAPITASAASVEEASAVGQFITRMALVRAHSSTASMVAA